MDPEPSLKSSSLLPPSSALPDPPSVHPLSTLVDEDGRRSLTTSGEPVQHHVQDQDQNEGEDEGSFNTNATITVRVIKSFEYRTQKSVVLKGLHLGQTTIGELMDRVREAIKTQSGFKAYRTLQLDTIKLYTVAHGHKTQNLIINLDHDEWIYTDMSKTLEEIGAKHETEFSMFNREAYEKFKLNPEVKWD